MDACEPTTNNADLWTCYLAEEWARWLDPFGLRRIDITASLAIAQATADSIASALAVLVGQPVDRLYRDNAPAVTHFIHDAVPAPDDIAIPPEYASNPPVLSASPPASAVPVHDPQYAGVGG